MCDQWLYLDLLFHLPLGMLELMRYWSVSMSFYYKLSPFSFSHVSSLSDHSASNNRVTEHLCTLTCEMQPRTKCRHTFCVFEQHLGHRSKNTDTRQTFFIMMYSFHKSFLRDGLLGWWALCKEGLCEIHLINRLTSGLAGEIRRVYYGDVIMTAMASQLASVLIVYTTVCLGADQRKHQSSASLAFVRRIHRWPVNSPHKGPITRKNVSIWWRHHDHRLPVGSPHKGPVMLNFDIPFSSVAWIGCLANSRCRWFETPWGSCDVTVMSCPRTQC